MWRIQGYVIHFEIVQGWILKSRLKMRIVQVFLSGLLGNIYYCLQEPNSGLVRIMLCNFLGNMGLWTECAGQLLPVAILWFIKWKMFPVMKCYIYIFYQQMKYEEKNVSEWKQNMSLSEFRAGWLLFLYYVFKHSSLSAHSVKFLRVFSIMNSREVAESYYFLNN
jgi:hypothetical protein